MSAPTPEFRIVRVTDDCGNSKTMLAGTRDARYNLSDFDNCVPVGDGIDGLAVGGRGKVRHLVSTYEVERVQ